MFSIGEIIDVSRFEIFYDFKKNQIKLKHNTISDIFGLHRFEFMLVAIFFETQLESVYVFKWTCLNLGPCGAIGRLQNVLTTFFIYSFWPDKGLFFILSCFIKIDLFAF